MKVSFGRVRYRPWQTFGRSLVPKIFWPSELLDMGLNVYSSICLIEFALNLYGFDQT